MVKKLKSTDVHNLMNSLPVMGEDGQLQQIKNSTCYTSNIAPLIYEDGRPVVSDDYVIHIRFEEGVAVSADFAQVWATLYYDDGQPIGVSLKPANYKGTPTISMFTTTDDDCNQKLYFRTTVTYNQADTNRYILPLNHPNEELTNLDDVWYRARLLELAKDNAIASFALALIKQQNDADNKQAVDYLIKASKQGYAHAFTQLSWCFKQGRGVEQDNKKWIQILKLAADANDPCAQYELAMAYINGDEVRCDIQKTIDLLEKAAKVYPKAQLALAKYYRYGSLDTCVKERLDYDSQHVPPLKLATKACNYFDVLTDKEWSGKVLAKFYLADCYEQGIGCDLDLDIAEQLYQEVVEVDNNEIETIEADFRLAKFKMLHAQTFINDGNNALGRGMFQEAKKSIQAVADFGYVPAQLFLAKELLSGKRFNKDHKLAFEFLSILDESQLSERDKVLAKRLILIMNQAKAEATRHAAANAHVDISSTVDSLINDINTDDSSLLGDDVSLQTGTRSQAEQQTHSKANKSSVNNNTSSKPFFPEENFTLIQTVGLIVVLIVLSAIFSWLLLSVL